MITAANESEAAITIDPSSTITYANEEAAQMFGYSMNDMIGKSLTLLIPERLREAHRKAIRRYVETKERHLDWSGVRLPALHASGQEFEVEIGFHEVEDPHRFVGVIREVEPDR